LGHGFIHECSSILVNLYECSCISIGIRSRETGRQNQEPLYYLKDWHLALEGDDESFYEWPNEFKSDWLNEFTIATGRQDYRFVYIGPKDSHTGFHQDVLKSHSWSSNVCGKKLWHFWAPGTHPKEKEGSGYITDPDILSSATFIVEQNTGQTLFVPSGWFHQVKNLEETVSINHNWINRHCIENTWEYLNEEMGKIFSELKYLKSDMESNGEWIQICQKILRSQTSMDFGEFLEFLQFLRGRRMKENSEGEDKEDIECLDRFIQKIKPIVEETLLEIKTFDKMGFDRP